MNVLAIVLACGKEEEIAPGTDGAFLTMGGGPMLSHSLKALQAAPSVDGVIVAVGKDRADATVQLVRRYGCTKVRGVVVGGANRASTLRIVFSKLPEPQVPVILLHEATRPFVGKDLIEAVVKAARRYGCAIAAHRLPEAVKIAPKGVKVAKTLDRGTVWVAQTPQAFKFEVLQKIVAAGGKVVDDESAFVRKPAEVHMVETGPGNLKIRSSRDLAVATALLNANLA